MRAEHNQSQFRVLALWPSGNVKYVLIDGQDSPGVGATDYTINVVKTTGSGANGGSNIITDNEDCAGNPNTNLLCANTGTAKFQIKKINFNLFDDVLVGSRHVVSSSNHGATDGLVLTGPRTGQFMPGAVVAQPPARISRNALRSTSRTRTPPQLIPLKTTALYVRPSR